MLKTSDRQRIIRKHIRKHFGVFGGAKMEAFIREGRIQPVIERGRVKFRVDNDILQEVAEMQKNHEVYGTA